jgi:polyisoprenoid-binding protein YceI
MYKRLLIAMAAVGAGAAAQAAPVTYTMDPAHTFPSFEAPHGEQMSIWRGKFNKNSGKVTLDKQAKTGTVEVTDDTGSVDFGFDAMNKVALGPDYFNVEKYPTATYKGTIVFKGDKPAKIKGQFTLLGITKPLDLELKAFKCMQNPMFKREICGADAYAEFNRGDFGMTKNINYGPMVTLRIAVEALEGDQPPGPPPGYKPPTP